jgi:uncharacterized membrane protein
MTATSTERYRWIDQIRGLAIILMIPANLAPYLAEPHPLWFRILGSYSAPTFIMLSAGMVILTSHKHDLAYYLKRALTIMAVGVLLDSLLWKICPFTSFDVLYTISISLPVIYFCRNQKTRVILLFSCLVFLGAILLQTYAGYHKEAYEIYWNEFALPQLPRLLQSWFIDGWFPIFPWVGFSLLGAVLFRAIFYHPEHVHFKSLLAGGAILLVIGYTLLFVPIHGLINLANGNIIASRDDYSEIFYPPSWPYLISAIGTVLFITAIFLKISKRSFLSIMGFYGRFSMLIYLLHQALGALALKPLIAMSGAETIANGWVFFLANLCVFAIISLICGLIELLKKKYPPRNVLLTVLFGH